MSNWNIPVFNPPPNYRVKKNEGTYRAGEIRGIIKIFENKCLGCDTCRKVCPANAIYGEIGMPHAIDPDKCINCGQCLINCPFGAIGQMQFVDLVMEKLKDPNTIVVALPAPAVRVAIAEEFDAPPGTLTVKRLYKALYKAGFDHIYDTNLAADQTIMEEVTEFIKKVKYWLLGDRSPELEEMAHHPLPHFTSCCPAWVRYAEVFYPEVIPHISNAKSPQQMAGASIKTWAALKLWKVDPRKIFVVAIMPCTAKIYEASRPEFCSAYKYLKEHKLIPEDTPPFPDVDAVITTRDLAALFKQMKINPLDMTPVEKLEPTAIYTGAGTIFGNSGGVCEAALRTAYYEISGKTPPSWNFVPVRGRTHGLRTYTLRVPRKDGQGVVELKVAVVNGIKNHLEPILEQVKAGRCPYHFIEVMNCPGGCIDGGGQPVDPIGTSWIDPLFSLRSI